MVKELDPCNVWGLSIGNVKKPKYFCGLEECKPWTRSEELPGRSYKTSANIGHPLLHPFPTRTEVRPLELGKDVMLRDYRLTEMNYKTSYQNDYTKKLTCNAAVDRPEVPHFLKFKLLYQWADKLRTAPPRKTFKPHISEMTDKYKPLQLKDGMGVLNDLKSQVVCEISAVAKEAQPKTYVEDQCVQKIMDPYISTQHYDYVYISPKEIEKYKHKKPEMIDLIPRRKEPVYDEDFLRHKQFLDRFIRKKIPTVPHGGLSTEARDNYRLPVDELSHKQFNFCNCFKVNPLTKGEVMAVPGMYHTEYSHIGQDWPLTSLI